MPSLTIYISLALLVFLMNIVPAFMPPTWVVLTFFYTTFHLTLLPTVLIGAITATLGRICLALLSKHSLRPFLPSKIAANYDYLGMYIKKHQHLTVPIVITYAFFPVSSNQLFIIAGLADLDIKIIAFSFFIGRLLSYTLWVAAAHAISMRLEDLFFKNLSNTGTIIGELLGIAVILIVGKINWKKLLK